MRLAIGCDHAGHALKEMLAHALEDEGHDVLDLGTFSTDPVDYPDFARAVGQAVARGFAEAGVLVGSSGSGLAVAANKVRGVRAALCHDLFTARESREEDDANVLCLGARVVDEVQALALASTWLATSFSGDDQHARRVGKVVQLETELPPPQRAPARPTSVADVDRHGRRAGPEAAETSPGEDRPGVARLRARAARSMPEVDQIDEDDDEPAPRPGAISIEHTDDAAAHPPRVRRAPPAPPALPDVFTLAPVEEALHALEINGFGERLWARDPSLWPGDAGEIRQRLGWLSAPGLMRGQVDEIRAFADEARRQPMSRVVLLGVGGSALAGEALALAFGSRMGFPDLEVFDSTDPAAVRDLLARLRLTRTLFVLASQSGTTPEPLALYALFRHQLEQERPPRPGMQFVAITDPESPLEQLASDGDFRRIFLNPASIGGPFSALSYFGLVPAALAGVDVRGLLERAQGMIDICGADVDVRSSPGARLGAALAGLARAGRDKVTLLFSPRLAPLGAWIEQLLAGATGKDGKGLVPIDGEPAGVPSSYGQDRVFVATSLASDRSLDATLVALAEAGQPVIRLTVKDPLDLGGEIFRWEVAAAAAAAVLGVNPFDDPEAAAVAERTRALLGSARTRRRPEWPVDCEEDGILLMTGSDHCAGSIADGVCAHLAQMLRADYLAILAYLAPTPETSAMLQDLRLVLRDQLRLATTLGYGPRYLHTTGQLHKGGPPSGLFIQITCDDPRDMPIPASSYGFSAFKATQALADLHALRDGGRRVIRLHVRRPAAEGLARVIELIRSVTSTP